MEIDKTRILSAERVEEIKKQIADCENRVKAAKAEETQLKGEYIRSIIESFKDEMLKDVEFEDKVKVTIKHWDGKTEDVEGFYHKVALSKYAYDLFDPNSKQKLVLILKKVKKDGTPSQKEEEISAYRVLAVKKVEE